MNFTWLKKACTRVPMCLKYWNILIRYANAQIWAYRINCFSCFFLFGHVRFWHRHSHILYSVLHPVHTDMQRPFSESNVWAAGLCLAWLCEWPHNVSANTACVKQLPFTQHLSGYHWLAPIGSVIQETQEAYYLPFLLKQVVVSVHHHGLAWEGSTAFQLLDSRQTSSQLFVL